MKPRLGFTLIELCVVVGLVSLLIGILLPAIQRVRGAASLLACKHNLRQMGLALHHYHQDYKRLPPQPVNNRPPSDPNRILGWMALLLPYLEMDALSSSSLHACQLDRNPLHDPPHAGLSTVIKLYVCPDDERLLSPLTDRFGVTAAFTSYIGIAGTLPQGARKGFDGILGGIPGQSFPSTTDGLSNTLMVGERPPPDSLQAGWWYPAAQGYMEGFRGPNNGMILGAGPFLMGDPCHGVRSTFGPGRTDNPCDRFHLWSLHSRGANFLFADGAVRFLPYSAEPVLMGMGSRNGGEIVDLSPYE